MIDKNGSLGRSLKGQTRVPLYIPLEAASDIDKYLVLPATSHASKGTQLDQRRHQPADWMTKSQVLRNFVEHDLPRITYRRLVKMQAAMKGHYVRRHVYPRLRQSHLIARILASSVLRAFLKVDS